MKQKIFSLLTQFQIPYTNYEHKPTHSCEDAKGVDVPGKRVKSLLLRNKHKTQFYMVVLPDEKRLDGNIVRKYFGENKLSFASADLMEEKIGVLPGHVSPFATVNNIEKNVIVVFDQSLQDSLIGIHPLQNDNTVVIQIIDVIKFLENISIKSDFIEL